MHAVKPHAGIDGVPYAPQVGDHLALNPLNTEAPSQGQAIDHWESREDMHRWLVRQGVDPAGEHTPSDLLQRGCDLWSAERKAIAAGKAGEPLDVQPLNVLLEAHLTSPRLQRDTSGRLEITHVSANGTAASPLGPVAEAAAHLGINDSTQRMHPRNRRTSQHHQPQSPILYFA